MNSLPEILHGRVLQEIKARAWSFSLPQIPCTLIFLVFIPRLYTQSLSFLAGILAVILGVIVFHTPVLAKWSGKRTEKFFLTGVVSVSLG